MEIVLLPPTNEHTAWHGMRQRDGCMMLSRAALYLKESYTRHVHYRHHLLPTDHNNRARACRLPRAKLAFTSPNLAALYYISPQLSLHNISCCINMCHDTIRHWQYCGHGQHIYGQFGHHVYNNLRRINDPTSVPARCSVLAISALPRREEI
jgi:hypothetical protein